MIRHLEMLCLLWLLCVAGVWVPAITLLPRTWWATPICLVASFLVSHVVLRLIP